MFRKRCIQTTTQGQDMNDFAYNVIVGILTAIVVMFIIYINSGDLLKVTPLNESNHEIIAPLVD